MLEIHNSDIQTWKRCRRKWDFTAPGQQHLEPDIPNKNLWLGSLVHEALADYYDTGVLPVQAFSQVIQKRTPTNLSAEDKEVFLANEELGKGMLKHYYAWSQEEDKHYKMIGAEIPFEVPIKNSAGKLIYKFAGTFDGVIWDKQDREYYILETKTAAKMGPWTFLESDEQVTNYLLAAEMVFDFPVAGVLYNVLRKKLPTKPKVLKNGKLSTSASIATTYQAYLQTVLAHGLDPMDYDEHLTYLEAQSNEFFHREHVTRSKHQLAVALYELEEVAEDMSQVERISLYASRTRDCEWQCQFLAPCQMMDDGWDFKAYLEENYKNRVRIDRPPRYTVTEINKLAGANSNTWN